MLQCICCRCGSLKSSGDYSQCIERNNTRLNHCFCCAQPPRMKCIHCNMWKDLEQREAHEPCSMHSMHVFVYTEPWPPFPDQIPLSPHWALPEADMEEDGNEIRGHITPDISHNNSNINSPEQIIDLDNDEQEAEEPPDIKPKLSSKAYWVTSKEIFGWTHCYRCGEVRIRRQGWLRHAQKCGQNPKYKTKKFFIHLHTKAWCGELVRDLYWDRHSNYETGTCETCRISRYNNVPLPFQPKPPTRKNQVALEKQRRSRILKNRMKRRQTMLIERSNVSLGSVEQMLNELDTLY